ncbi:MAG TPA: cell division protein FtsQ/DivIB [Steroidobacteraceae bacterium]|jgi:cell division protein FtsQ|nr:cell division protein FtsQ/DivIB [Steroidobacteraceae bacterium]
MIGVMHRNRFKAKPKAEKRRWQWPAAVRNWRLYVRRGGLVLALIGALSALTWALDRPVKAISIDGRFQRVSPGQIEKAVAPFASQGFMSANLADIQRAVESLPWVDHARIARRWPNSLRVTVTEQTAAARWGESGLLNTRGELFVRAAAHVPAELPRLSGPDGTESTVAQRYLAVQGRMLEAGMRIAALRLDERGAWEMDLDSGVTVRLGRRDVDARIDRFIHTASQVIAHRLTEINYVDMRYSNGFAIGWRNQSTPASGPAKHSDDADA